MFSEGNLQRYLEAAVGAAREAGKLQKELLWSDFSISHKGEVDLVTEVDRRCEEMVVARLREATPDFGFLAEENQYQDGSTSHRWVIDPVDGTTNYAHGFPWFCVSIALEVEGSPVLGVIYHVMMDELFTAIRGKGAYLNGKKMQVSQHEPLKGCLLATGFPYDRTWDNENNFNHFCAFHMETRGVRRAGAAALDLAYVAAGRLDGFWECKLKPWDVAAGVLLVAEAGGVVTNYAGEAYSIYDHRVVASNGRIHKDMIGVLARSSGG
ncbi:inositol monophosphatase [Geomonas sp. RF6]|uniref:inositol monophosphatase family protein n=1 Tax=Geomonas sp. RF6 TaxID=2897342 RepID=UPI001E5B7841|nr:inositol monophosphatase family protein [Geomonas sp. RF6]UFS69627.1 inositol monophosphatase [Geomonas sp. RF6]